MTVSLDGGRTFGAPVDTGLSAYYEVAVAGGAPGVAVVAASGPAGFGVVRTDDSGVTWQPPVVLRAGAGTIRLLAAGDRMLLSADTDMGQTWWLSADGGRTFQSSRPAITGRLMSVGLDPDGTIWTVSYDGSVRLSHQQRRRQDLPMGPRFPIDGYFNAIGVGPNLLFAAGQDVSPSPGTVPVRAERPGPDRAVRLLARAGGR